MSSASLPPLTQLLAPEAIALCSANLRGIRVIASAHVAAHR